jgi:hypothetical protein
MASLLWLWAVEGMAPDRWDAVGAGMCLVGAAVILWAPRMVEKKIYGVFRSARGSVKTKCTYDEKYTFLRVE